MASLNEITVQIAQLRERLRIARQELAKLDPNVPGNRSAIARYQLEVNDLPVQISALEAQLSALESTASAGEIAREDQAARAANSAEVNPPGSPTILKNGRIQLQPETTASSNSQKSPPEFVGDFGTDAELRPYIQTQSVPPGSSQASPGPSVAREDQYVPGGQPGVGAAGEDSRGGTNPTVTELNNIDYGTEIIPRANVLDDYASYSYQASLYLIDDIQYLTMINTKRKDLSGATLLIQTGGAGTPAERNDTFNLDYYLDNIELSSFIVGKGTGLAHNVADVKMTIIEPNGITFLKNLEVAVANFVSNDVNKKKNYIAQLYLLVIRFYGYDNQGNLVRGGVNKPDQTSDPNAFVEKWYPLLLSNVHFKIQNKSVEYQIEAMAVPYRIGASGARGTIPYNVELSGQTLKDLLAGPAVYSAGQDAASAAAQARRNFAFNDPRRTDRDPTAPPKADTANTVRKTVRAGLMAALNEYQRDLKKDKIIDLEDNYEIEFALQSLANAKITNPGLNKSATSMATPGTAEDAKLGSKQSMDPNSRAQGLTAGMQIVQFIDNCIRTSSYIKDQQLLTYLENNKGEPVTTGINIKNTSWYKISFEATPRGWDKKRNDYAYNIKFIISPYKISQLNTPFFKPPLYNGSHKQYSYWFTGQNDAVLEYEENLNALYYQIMSGTQINETSNAIDLLRLQYQTRSGQTDQGAKNKTNEPSANAADQLYSIADLGECRVTIVGDPAWLQQGEAWAGFYKSDSTRYQPFLTDGTINFDSQQILFEIGYNIPQDYDLYTGLIQPKYGDPNSISQQNQKLRRQGQTQINRIYIATEARSRFARGKFTQEIKGSLMVYTPTKVEQNQNQRDQNTAAAKVNTSAPQWENVYKNLPSGGGMATDPTKMSPLAKGTQALLRPTTNGELSDPQLRSTPVYNQSRRSGESDATALEKARAASQSGTNNYQGIAVPGIRDTTNTTPQLVLKDQ